MFDIALGIYLFLTPIFILPTFNARLNGLIGSLQFYQFGTLSNVSNLQLQFFQFGIIVLFVIALTQKPQRVFKDRYAGWLLGLCLLSVFFYTKTVSAFTNVFLGFLLYYLVVVYTSSIRKVLLGVVFVSALNTVFAVLQFFGIHWIYSATPRIEGLMKLNTHLGIYQAIALPICYMLNPFLAIIPLIGLSLSQCATGIVAGIVGMGYLLRKKLNGYVFSMSVLVLTVIYLIRTIDNIATKFSVRFCVWLDTIREILYNWKIGQGLGTFEYEGAGFGHYLSPYNVILEVSYYLGIFGLLLFILFLKDKLNLCRGKVAKSLHASFLIILVCGLFQPFLTIPRLVGTGIVITALLNTFKTEDNYG